MTTELRIITNNVPRDVIDAWELSEDERKQFDYLDWSAIEDGRDSASFVRYKGWIYDLGEFTWTGAVGIPDLMRTWDGYLSESFFSGVLIRYVENNERVIVGRYLS